jgi:ATP-dependent HslUV protease, peptidase subunit HslV
MTTITVVRKGGYAAIAADTLTKYGYTKESADYVVNPEKILKVGAGYVGLAGSMAGFHALELFFSRAGSKAKLNSVLNIFTTWNELHRALKDEFFINAQADGDDSFETSRVSAVIANPHGIFSVTAYRSVQEYTRFSALGTGDDFALGAMYAAYGDEGRTAEEIARLGVAAAAEFDEDTGPPVMSYAVKLRKG